MSSSRPVFFFAAALVFGVLLATLLRGQLLTVAVLLAVPACAMLGLAIFIRYNSRGPRLPGAPAAGAAPPAQWPQNLGTAWALAWTATAAVATFLIWPQLDLDLAQFFYRGANTFAGQGTFGNFGRQVGYVAPFLVLAAYLLGWAAQRAGWPTPFSPKGRDVLFLTLAMIVGPGLVVNLGMKDHLHRPRPAHLAQFGGSMEFRPFYRFDGSCRKNCSFPSGEASEAFWMIAPASLMPLPWRGPAMAGAVVFGGAVGLLRMAFGGHFFSDVVFAALITWGLVLALRRWIYG